MKIGATTIPLAGWVADPRRPEEARESRLQAIRQMIAGYRLAAVELSLDLGLVYPQIFDSRFYAQVAELQGALGFTCTVHLPFLWIDPASLNEPIRQASQECLRQGIELTGALQVESYVLHLWGNTTVQIATLLDNPAHKQALLGFVLAQAERSLAALCQQVEPSRLCLETLEAPPFDFALPLVEKYDTAICLDVGHMAWQSGDAMSFLERHRERIREVHLHDARQEQLGANRLTRDHLPLGQGEFDYLGFMHKLQELDFDGAVILENNTRADLEQSLEALGGYLHG